MQSISLIDWLSFSLPTSFSSYEETTPTLHRLLGQQFPTASYVNDCGQPVTDRPYRIDQEGANWYRERHIIRSYHGNPLAHVMIGPTSEKNGNTSAFSVTGYGFSNRPDALRHLDLVDLLVKVKDMGGKLTRIDLALDHFGPEPVLQHMFSASRPEVWQDRIITPLRFERPVPVGFDEEAIYYGHLKKSGFVICAYDKAQQSGTPGPWTRIEFRTRDRDVCASILEEIVSGRPIGELTSGLIRHYLRFVPPPGKKSKYNRPIAPWWDELLTAGASFNLQRHSAGKMAEDKEKERQAPTRDAFMRYARDALRLDSTGEIALAVSQLHSEIQAAKDIQFR